MGRMPDSRVRVHRNCSVGIVGGGAAGMMAAITAARQGARVTLMEGNDRLGKKILVTGNGKCNFGNEKLDPEEYYTGNPDFLAKCLKKFNTEDSLSFFRSIGLMAKSKNGYLYPACGQASAVLDVLRYEVRALGVRVITDCKIQKVEQMCGNKTHGQNRIRLWSDGTGYEFDRVILACGGRAAPKTGSDGSGYRLAQRLGHSLVPTVPALVQLKCREDYFKAVAGVRADALLKVTDRGKCIAEERGELQLTETGISGIPVFQISRVANYLAAGRGSREVEVVIDFLPDYTEEAYERFMAGRSLLLREERTVEEFFTGMLHKKLMLLFIRLSGLKPSEAAVEADGEKLRRVYDLCRHWSVHVTGSASYDSAQVCAGGIPLDEVTPELESKKMRGVYFAGELLDVDGKCGGYNLHWAWCSGYLAGRAAALQKPAPGPGFRAAVPEVPASEQNSKAAEAEGRGHLCSD